VFPSIIQYNHFKIYAQALNLLKREAMVFRKSVLYAKEKLAQLTTEHGNTFQLTKLINSLSVKSTKGEVTFVFRKQVRKKRPYKTLGKLSSSYSIEQALTDCWEHELCLKENGVINEDIYETQKRIGEIETFDDIACEFFLHHDDVDFPVGNEPLQSLPHLQQKYVDNIRPIIGHVLITAIDRRHINQVTKSILNKGNSSSKHDYTASANHAIYIIKKILALAVEYKLTNLNAAENMTAKDVGYKVKKSRKALMLTELKTLIHRLESKAETEPANVYAVYLLILLGPRKMELISAKVSDFMIDLIPVNNGLSLVEDIAWKQKTTKTGGMRSKYIPPFMQECLNRLVELGNGSDYLLPARKSNSSKPHISSSTLNKFIKRISGDLKFSVHELRHTTRTLLSVLSISDYIAESYICHSNNNYMHDIYHLYPERKEAAIKLSNYIETLVKYVREEDK